MVHSSGDEDEAVALVLDVGSYTMSYGVSGEETPGFAKLATYTKDGTEGCKAPIHKGKLTDKDRMDEIIKMAVDDVGIRPEDKYLLMSNPNTMSLGDKAALLDITFECNRFPGCLTISQAALGLYCSGNSSGLCLDIGYHQTTVVPVYEGYPLIGCPSILTSPISGLQLDDVMKKFNPKLVGLGSVEMTSLKKELCQISETETSMTVEVEPKEFELPDESKVSVGNEAHFATELLFTPHHFGVKSPGCHELIYNSLHKVDPDGHKDIIGSVLPMGGTSRIPGFSKRLELELLGVLNHEFRIINQSEREKEHMTWIGGSIVAELSTFQEMWVFRSEYEEEGPDRMVKRKLLF
ncbi:hypothetical protein ACHWQZ_G016735 [Mnemiopsis leidyi]